MTEIEELKQELADAEATKEHQKVHVYCKCDLGRCPKCNALFCGDCATILNGIGCDFCSGYDPEP